MFPIRSSTYIKSIQKEDKEVVLIFWGKHFIEWKVLSSFVGTLFLISALFFNVGKLNWKMVMESRELLGKKNAPRNTDRVKQNNSPQVSVKNIFENGADQCENQRNLVCKRPLFWRNSGHYVWNEWCLLKGLKRLNEKNDCYFQRFWRTLSCKKHGSLQRIFWDFRSFSNIMIMAKYKQSDKHKENKCL